MGLSDPVRYPARPGSAEAVRQDIWRTRRDLEEALSELMTRLDVKAAARRRASAAARALTHSPIALGAAGLAVATGAAIAAVPVIRKRWRIAAVGALGVVAGAVVVSRRRPVIVPDTVRAGGLDLNPDVDPASAAPGDPVAAMVPPGGLADLPGPPGGDVVDLLITQHRMIDSAFRSVLASTGGAKLERFTALVDLINRHEHAEQELVHPLLDRVDGAERVIERLRADEAVNDRMLGRLISMGVDDASFDNRLADLAASMASHAAIEEAEEFALLRACLPDERRQTLAREVRAAQSEPW